MIAEYVLEDTDSYRAVRLLAYALGAVVIVAALSVAIMQKVRPW